MPDPFTLLGFVFILGALIFIHESGHYMVAKALGIRVEVFSLGFGPRLLGFVRGGTEYRISAVPLGGYVKMLGENPDEALRGTREEFLSRRKSERFLVLVMGASLNIVLAVVLTAGIFMHGVAEAKYMTEPPVVGWVDPNAAAAQAGLQVKDELLAVDGHELSTWRDLQLNVALIPGQAVSFSIRRDGRVIEVPVTVGATRKEKIGVIGIGPYSPLMAAEVEAGGPAERAGLRQGDLLEAVNGKGMFGSEGWQAYAEAVSAGSGKPIKLTVRRDGQPLDLEVTPVEKDGKGDIGVGASLPFTQREYGPVDAFVESAKVNWDQAGVLFLTLKKLVSGQLSPRTLSGPIDIYRLTGESLRSGWVSFLAFMSLVSLQLGIINLLPIPILDGGHIFILFVEGLIRRDLSMQIKERVMQFGFVLLLVIMGGVLYLDVYKNFFIK
jgi:regulator of sigma E protease